jgi:transcriptional regulator with XRE-family HTH domain
MVEAHLSGLGSEVRRLREEQGWTQNQLSVFAGVSQPTVNQIETGKRNPSTATVVKLADALGVGVSDLFPKASGRSSLEPSLLNGLEDEWLEATPDAPIVKESAATAHLRTTAAARPAVLYILRRVARGEISPEEGLQQIEAIGA